MAISEETKRIAAKQRADKELQIKALTSEIEAMASQTVVKQDLIAKLQAEIDALKADIPEPTPEEV